MKRIVLFTLSLVLLVSLTSCDGKKNEASTTDSSQSSVAPASDTTASAQSDIGNPVTVTMADGSQLTATFVNGFYRFEAAGAVKVMELQCFADRSEDEYAQAKLLLEGDAPNAIVLVVPGHLGHGDYQTAWENADGFMNIEENFDGNGSYGIDTSLQLPTDFWNYELRVFDDRQGEKPVELAFLSLAINKGFKIGELILTNQKSNIQVKSLVPDKTEYNLSGSEKITGQLVAEGWGDEAWIGVVPSGVPHGDDDCNDTYDESFDYLSSLENGKFSLELPSAAGHYDLRICDGTVEVAYMTFTIK